MQAMSNGFDWNDLKYLLACSRTGSLAAAGRLLKVDQTTVGRRLATLEHSLGARLFDRTSDGFVLTTTGEHLMEQAHVVEQGAIDLARRASGEDVRLEGVVRLATTSSLSSAIAPFLGTLHRAHPGITLDVLTANTASNLLRREADLALRVGNRPTQQTLITRKLGTVSFCLYGGRKLEKSRPRKSRHSDNPLAGFDVIAYSDDLASTAVGRWIDQHTDETVRVVFRSNSFDLARLMTRGGWGVTVLPRYMGDVDPELVRVIDETFSPIGLWTVVHADLQRASRVRAVMDHIVAAVRQAKVID